MQHTKRYLVAENLLSLRGVRLKVQFFIAIIQHITESTGKSKEILTCVKYSNIVVTNCWHEVTSYHPSPSNTPPRHTHTHLRGTASVCSTYFIKFSWFHFEISSLSDNYFSSEVLETVQLYPRLRFFFALDCLLRFFTRLIIKPLNPILKGNVWESRRHFDMAKDNIQLSMP